MKRDITKRLRARIWEYVSAKHWDLRDEAAHVERLREALRLAADEPNIDKARAIADKVLNMTKEAR